MQPAAQFVDGTSIATFGGATIVVVAISLALRKAFNLNSPQVPFWGSAGVVLASSYRTIGLEPLNWLIAFGNVCLLYAAAVGTHETVAEKTKSTPAGGGEQQGKKRHAYNWRDSFLKE